MTPEGSVEGDPPEGGQEPRRAAAERGDEGLRTERRQEVLPEGFVMAAKSPQVITHEMALQDCGADVSGFLGAMEHLGDRLGPLLPELPYFNKASGMTAADFVYVRWLGRDALLGGRAPVTAVLACDHLRLLQQPPRGPRARLDRAARADVARADGSGRHHRITVTA